MRKMKKIILTTSIIFVLALTAVLAASLYPFALVHFSGIHLVTNGSTTQGFIDITLKNIDATGVSFCLKYDKDIFSLSDVNTNTPIVNDVDNMNNDKKYNISHKYFEQNTEKFPDKPNVFIDKRDSFNISGISMPIIGIADADNGYLLMNFLPTQNASYQTGCIEEIEHDGFIRPSIMAGDEDLLLGRLSFCIKDPAKFSKLTEDQLKEAIKIVPVLEMADIVDGPVDDGVNLAYLDEDGIVRWYSQMDKHIGYKLEIKTDLESVKLDNEEMTVSSYDIYKTGTKQDLIDFLNEKMYKIKLKYSDGSEVPAVINWDESDEGITDVTWNPKQGSYTATHRYNDKFSVTATVNVTPVNLTGFSVENQYMAFSLDDPNFPQSFLELRLPEKVQPILDTYIPNDGIPAVPVEKYIYDGNEITDLPADFNTVKDFEFELNVDSWLSSIKAPDSMAYPWLTVLNPDSVTAIRSVVATSADLPDELEIVSAEASAPDTDIRQLTITVKYKDAADGTTPTMTDATTFKIKMPGGQLIDTDSLLASGKYQIEFNDTHTQATITIKADITDSSEQQLAQLINLGDRAGNFAISAKEETKPQGNYVSFSFSPRRNVYTGPDYNFDYSALSSAMFPVTQIASLPTTVTLPYSSDVIYTSYNGFDGTEAGALSTFTVESWEQQQNGEGVLPDPTVAGNIITVKGLLANTSYTNYGEVYNDNNVYVTISYYVAESVGTESIADIEDFVYDTQQVGYDYDLLQTKEFTIQNTGATDIYGISVLISMSSGSDGSNTEAFVLTNGPQEILSKGGSSSFEITTKHGLPAHTSYVSTVTIMSNERVLDTFQITFTVSEEPVYKITLTVDEDQKGFGTAKRDPEMYTAEKGDIVKLVATPEEDCKFVGWEIVGGNEDDEGDPIIDVSESDLLKEQLEFLMPGQDIEIKAKFDESLGAKLRATDLIVKDMNSSVYPGNGSDQILYNDAWETITFVPTTREYYVAVPNTSESVALWFKLRPEADKAIKTVKYSSTQSGEITIADDNVTPVVADADGYYKVTDIKPTNSGLYKSPTDNIVTLNLTYDDPDDDEGEVTRKYTIHVYRRLAESDLMTLNYGNSPAGLIMGDNAHFPDMSSKETALQSFKDNNYTFMPGQTPNGAVEGTTYSAEAWTSETENCDINPMALFVINDKNFSNPGYSAVKNSIGGAVGAVSAEITVNLLNESVSEKKNGSSEDFAYVTETHYTIADSGMVTELRKARIRPDRYSITYSFEDFDGSIVKITRPTIILSPLGDINIDYNVDDTDAERMLRRFKDNPTYNDVIGGIYINDDIADNTNVPAITASSDYSVGGLIYKYRVCDTNKSGNFNAVDAMLVKNNTLTSYYTNTVDGGGT